MNDFIPMTCPSCGGELQITEDITFFTCLHCKTRHAVKRGVGTISIDPITEGIKNIQVGVDKTASELAIKRLNEEIKKLKYIITVGVSGYGLDIVWKLKRIPKDYYKDHPKYQGQDFDSYYPESHLKKYIEKKTGKKKPLFGNDFFIDEEIGKLLVYPNSYKMRDKVASSRQAIKEMLSYFKAQKQNARDTWDEIFIYAVENILQEALDAHDALEAKQAELERHQAIVSSS